MFLPVTVLGFAALVAAVWTLSEDTLSAGFVAGVAVLLAAAIFAEAFPVPVENLPAGRVSLAAIFILGTALIYGWAAAVVVGFLTRATLEFAERRPLVKRLYNSALYALAAAAAGAATAQFSGDEGAGMLVLEVLAGAAAFYVVNIPLVAAIMALATREPFLPLLRESAKWTAASSAIMASVSLALYVLWEASPVLAAALVGPLVAVALYQRSTHDALRAMRLALTDPLTGLGNHRYFQDELQLALDRAAESGSPLSLCLLDLDNFKQVQRPVRSSGRRQGSVTGRGEASRGRERVPPRRRRVRARPARVRRGRRPLSTPMSSSRRSGPTRPSTAARSASPAASRRSRSTARTVPSSCGSPTSRSTGRRPKARTG